MNSCKNILFLILLTTLFSAGLLAEDTSPISWTAELNNENEIELQITIEEGYYQAATPDFFYLIIDKPENIHLDDIIYPDMHSFTGTFNLRAPLLFTEKKTFDIDELSVTLYYQLCNSSTCFIPKQESKSFKF